MRTWVGNRLLCGAVILSSVAGLPGCSFLFVTSPKHVESTPAAAYTPVECTSSKVAPAVDTVLAGLEVARTVYAATADKSVYEGAPISRGADIAFGLGFLALFGASAIWGYSVTSECSRLHNHSPAHSAPPPEADEHGDPNDVSRPRPAPKTPETDTSP